ncbi:MAG TPA: DUF4145 domain-containing protein [Candidatus Limnocylindrales bacterium]|nr:DUF4145 domain-containing protein [Candidatus Limnocylindrales bacterium]
MSRSTPRSQPPTFKFESDKRDGQVMLLICPDCRRFTNHEVLKSIEYGWERYNYEIYGYDEYLIVKCSGCNRPSYLTISTDSESYDEDGPAEIRTQFPSTNTDYVIVPLPYNTPPKVRLAYQETSNALSNGLKHLGAVGIRMIAELICEAEGATGKDLFEKIDDLHDKSIISKIMADNVQALRFLGNESVHEFEVNDYEIQTAWQVVSSLIDFVYRSKDNSERLLTPKRLMKLEQARLKQKINRAKKN